MFDMKVVMVQPKVFTTMFFQDFQFRFIAEAQFISRTVIDTHKAKDNEIDCLIRYNDRIVKGLEPEENSAFFFKTKKHMVPRILDYILMCEDKQDSEMLDWIIQEFQIIYKDIINIYNIIQKKDFGDQVAITDGGDK